MRVHPVYGALLGVFVLTACSATQPPAIRSSTPASTTPPSGAPSALAGGKVLFSSGGIDLYWSAPDGTGRVALTKDGATGGYVGGRPSPDGEVVAAERVIPGESGSALVLLRTGAPPLRLTKVDTFLDGYAWSPDGRFLTYGEVLSGATAAAGGLTGVGAVGDVHLYDVQRAKDFIVGPGTHPAFSADGKRLGYAHLSGAIALVDLAVVGQSSFSGEFATRMLVTLADLSRISSTIAPKGMGLIGGPQFSADGRYVAYAAIEKGPILDAEQIVYVQEPVPGAIPRQWVLGKTGAIHHVAEMRWSPTDPVLAYSIINAQPHHHWLAVIDLRSGDRRELYDSQKHFLDYSWSPDGAAILLQVDDGDQWLYFRPDRAGPIGLVSPGGWRPEWCRCSPRT